MPALFRLALVATLATTCHGLYAQTTVPPDVTVQRIAPQLVTFAGSQANFQNLVTGLAAGTQVQLVSVLPDGSAQVVSFTPGATVPAEQIAPTLEAARQRLIGLGIGAPTAEQLALSLTGGTIPTPLGGAPVNGMLNPQNTPSPAVQVQAVAPLTAQSSSAINQPLDQPLAAPRVNTSDSAIPSGATSRTPTLQTAPITAPGVGSTPPALERVPTTPANRAVLRH
jgi:hypothetical protein